MVRAKTYNLTAEEIGSFFVGIENTIEHFIAVGIFDVNRFVNVVERGKKFFFGVEHELNDGEHMLKCAGIFDFQTDGTPDTNSQDVVAKFFQLLYPLNFGDCARRFGSYPSAQNKAPYTTD